MTRILWSLGLILAIGATPATARTFSVRIACNAAPRCFASLSEALAAADRAPLGEAVTIRIGTGTFRDKPVIRRAGLRIVGQGRARSRLVFDAAAGQSSGRGDGRWGTAGSATLTVAAPQVTIADLTIENDFAFPANDALPAGDPRRITGSQAVAVTLDPGSDDALFDRVALLGHQDTLYTRGGRATIRRSLIAGTVDFIFGNGMLLIEDSEVRTRRRGSSVATGVIASFVTAPSTPLRQPIGIVVHRSRLTREAGVPDASAVLGRPWHPTARFADGRYADPDAVGQAVFIDCWMDAHIHPDGWTDMTGTARDGGKTAIFRPEDSRFAEVGSRGPGAGPRNRRIRWRGVPDMAAIRSAFATPASGQPSAPLR